MRPLPDSHAVGTVHKGDRPLTTIDEWHRFAPPKRDIHWRDEHSANKENARAWLDAAPGLQPDIAQILAACCGIGPLRRWCAEPEACIPIDSFRGEPPNIDLLVIAEDDHGPVVIAIEAKVNEPFGQTLEYKLARASNPRSNAVARVEALLHRFALDIKQPHVLQLRYQLLTATAAVLARADGVGARSCQQIEANRRSSARAVLIVHEFVTRCTRPRRCKSNADHLDHFLATALDCEVHLAPGDVAGPILVQGAPTLYVGKARTVVAGAPRFAT